MLVKHIEDETRPKKGFPPPTPEERAIMDESIKPKSDGEDQKQIKED